MTAANPAICLYGCEGNELPRFVPPGHPAFLHERIRALEAENDAIKNMRNDWEAHARRAEARVKELEREVASWRRTAEVIEAREREASR